ncbi:MAG TPA: desulforedoxin [Acidimicrobiia bacterium]|nr:desulforedoxin [Acidimicrobiia bacterium]
MGLRVGMRLRCDQCGSEAIITTAGDAELECCGAPLTVTFEPAASGATTKDEG